MVGPAPESAEEPELPAGLKSVAGEKEPNHPRQKGYLGMNGKGCFAGGFAGETRKPGLHLVRPAGRCEQFFLKPLLKFSAVLATLASLGSFWPQLWPGKKNSEINY